MKVQCDVCAAEAASVFCCADEAALCDACDRRVHRANKLAGKHRRFSLLNPAPPFSSSGSSAQQAPPPLCDICQVLAKLLLVFPSNQASLIELGLARMMLMLWC